MPNDWIIKDIRVGNVAAREELHGALKAIADLRTIFEVVGDDDFACLEHFAARSKLPMLLKEAAAELRKKFPGSPLGLTWEDGNIYLVVKTTTKAEEGEELLSEFFDWWIPRRNVEDRTTVTIEYVRGAERIRPNDGFTAQPTGATPKENPTDYHSPRLMRTIMGGPGNRSSIINCKCGGQFDGTYEYIGHAQRMCDWYAQHAGITGGGATVARVLREYDKALDIIRYPDHPCTKDNPVDSPIAILALLRRKLDVIR